MTALDRIKHKARWRAKQRLAGASRYYGDGGTIHTSGSLNVEVCDGHVVAVWFRCQMLPFKQRDVDTWRAEGMQGVSDNLPTLTGVEVLDRPRNRKENAA